MTADQLDSPFKKPLLSVQVVIVLLAVIFCAITELALGHRADLTRDVTALPVAFSLKASFFVLVLLSSISGLRLALVPTAAERWNDSLFVLTIVTLMSALVIEAALVPAHAILADFKATQPQTAMLAVAVYGFLGAVILVRLLRRYTIHVSQKAAAWLGLAAATAGALGYSIYCPSGSPAFVVIVYGAPCLLVSCVTALIAPRSFKN